MNNIKKLLKQNNCISHVSNKEAVITITAIIYNEGTPYNADFIFSDENEAVKKFKDEYDKRCKTDIRFKNKIIFFN